MKQQFQVVYETRGVKVINVWLPEGVGLPEGWESMTYQQQDEWLYDNQFETKKVWADEHHGQAVNVLPVLSLKAV